MSQAEIENGKVVVEGLIEKLCKEHGVRLTSAVVWHNGFNRETYWIEFEVEHQIKRWPITYEALEDCVNDKTVRRMIELGLSKFLIPVDPDVRHSPRGSEADLPSAEPQPNQSEGATFDVFICHASEDKDFVDPLAIALKESGVKVWYDRFVLEWGDDLRSSIDGGLSKSKYGIVIFSPAFLKKRKWTGHELSGLFAKENQGEKVILPIWHNIKKEDIVEYGPSFEQRLYKDSARDSVGDIVAALKAKLNKCTFNGKLLFDFDSASSASAPSSAQEETRSPSSSAVGPRAANLGIEVTRRSRLKQGIKFEEAHMSFPRSSQRIAAFSFGFIFVVVMLVLAVLIPNLMEFQLFVFRIVLALAAAGVAATIPGFINVDVKPWLRGGCHRCFRYNLFLLTGQVDY